MTTKFDGIQAFNQYKTENASSHFILETHETKADNNGKKAVHVYAVAIPLEKFSLENLKIENKSEKIKYRRNNKTDKYYQRIADFIIDCGTLTEFNENCKRYKENLAKSKGKENPETKQYNRGWHLERIVYKHFKRRWVRFDNTPHGKAGDFEHNGIKYQIKANDGEF